jgi:hypothetical protein
MKILSKQLALVRISLVGFSSLCLPSCESTNQQPQSRTLVNQPLEGDWHYDSSRTAIYDAQARLISTFKNPIPLGAFLTVGPTQWRYTGSLREEHAYTRHRDTLVITRLGDQHLVDSHYISPEGIGKAIGHPDQFIITSLTARQLVMRDSTRTSDGSRVSYLYHSRSWSN